MQDFEHPTYVIDLSHEGNRDGILKAQPNIPITVLVVPSDDLAAKAIHATGRLGEDSIFFHVEVTTHAGSQAHVWNWESLRTAVGLHKA